MSSIQNHIMYHENLTVHVSIPICMGRTRGTKSKTSLPCNVHSNEMQVSQTRIWQQNKLRKRVQWAHKSTKSVKMVMSMEADMLEPYFSTLIGI